MNRRAIRINPKEGGGLVGRRFAKDRLVLAAAPTLKIPDRQDSAAVRIDAVVMPSHREGELWRVKDAQISYEPRPVLRLSSLMSIRDAVICGAGAAMLPQSIIVKQLESRELVSWGISGTDTELWVMHTSRRLQSPKVRAFVEYLCQRYPTGWFEI